LELGQSTSLTLEKEKSGFLLANGLKSYLNVDRVTLIEQTGTQMRTLAVSGQVTFNRRANVVRYTERLAQVVLKSGEALWFELGNTLTNHLFKVSHCYQLSNVSSLCSHLKNKR